MTYKRETSPRPAVTVHGVGNSITGLEGPACQVRGGTLGVTSTPSDTGTINVPLRAVDGRVGGFFLLPASGNVSMAYHSGPVLLEGIGRFRPPDFLQAKYW
jgi:hypothetical protein